MLIGPFAQGGQELELEAPWDRLDAYSEIVRIQRPEAIVEGLNGAPEWNWCDMLKAVKVESICELFFIMVLPDHCLHSTQGPLTSGTSHLERGSEFWAFKLISSVINEESFSSWIDAPSTQATS
jgi:hypothetical protein